MKETVRYYESYWWPKFERYNNARKASDELLCEFNGETIYKLNGVEITLDDVVKTMTNTNSMVYKTYEKCKEDYTYNKIGLCSINFQDYDENGNCATPYMIFDIDKLSEDEAISAFNLFKNLELAKGVVIIPVLMFISPSNKGVKLIYKIDSDKASISYWAYQQFYISLLGIFNTKLSECLGRDVSYNLDLSSKSFRQMCYLPHRGISEIFYDPFAIPLDVPHYIPTEFQVKNKVKSKNKIVNDNIEYVECDEHLFNDLIYLTENGEKGIKFDDPNSSEAKFRWRNRLTGLACSMGLSLESLLLFLKQQYKLTPEIIVGIASLYKKNIEDGNFGNWCKEKEADFEINGFLDEIREELIKLNGHIIDCPTGLGKTTYALNSADTVVLIVPYRIMADEFMNQYNLQWITKSTIIKPGQKYVVVYDSVKKILNPTLEGVRFFVDEYHNFTTASNYDFRGQTIQMLMDFLKQVEWWQGLTGTSHVVLNDNIIKIKKKDYIKRKVMIHYCNSYVTKLEQLIRGKTLIICSTLEECDFIAGMFGGIIISSRTNDTIDFVNHNINIGTKKISEGISVEGMGVQTVIGVNITDPVCITQFAARVRQEYTTMNLILEGKYTIKLSPEKIADKKIKYEEMGWEFNEKIHIYKSKNGANAFAEFYDTSETQQKYLLNFLIEHPESDVETKLWLGNADLAFDTITKRINSVKLLDIAHSSYQTFYKRSKHKLNDHLNRYYNIDCAVTDTYNENIQKEIRVKYIDTKENIKSFIQSFSSAYDIEVNGKLVSADTKSAINRAIDIYKIDVVIDEIFEKQSVTAARNLINKHKNMKKFDIVEGESKMDKFSTNYKTAFIKYFNEKEWFNAAELFELLKPHTSTIIVKDLMGKDEQIGLYSPIKLSRFILPMFTNKDLKKTIKGKKYYKIAGNFQIKKLEKDLYCDAFLFA